MSPQEIQHFLIVYDIASATYEVERYGADYDTALKAYGNRENEYRGRPDIEVVLLGADSLDTVKKTHSSYFSERGADDGFARYFERELAAG